MYRVLFKLVCICYVIVINHALENEFSNDIDTSNVNQPYNIQRLYSSNLKDKLPNLIVNRFNSKDGEYLLESPEYSSQNSSKCVKDILYTFQSATNFSNQWAWKFLDSYAKPESGILLGNLKWVGEYNECLKVYAPPKLNDSTVGNFNGQYCSVGYSIPLFNQSIPLTFGICLPDSCSTKDLQDEVLTIIFKTVGFPVSNKGESVSNSSATITCRPRERSLHAAGKFVIVLICIFCTLAVAGSSVTAVKYFQKLLQDERRSSLIINMSDQVNPINDPQAVSIKNGEPDVESMAQVNEYNGFLENCASFLSSFCVFTNGAKLLNTGSSEGQMLCIHGIRFLSMSWVILGHAYMFDINTGQLRNMIEGTQVVNDFLFQVVLQGFFSVDSFFVLSGFLLTYLSMTEFSKSNGSINWIYFYVHRYIRLTPIYMIILGFFATVYFYLGSGPSWLIGDSDANCAKNWYKNLLYINNIDDISEQCMGWSWYLANDMQFFIISPIFLITLWRWPLIGYISLGVLSIISMLCNFVITFKFDLPVGIVGLDVSGSSLNAQEMSKYLEYFSKLYIKPYGRIGAYLTGIIVGHIVFKHKTNNWNKLKWYYLCIGWIVASVLALTLVYGFYKAHPALVTRSFYNAFNRICFGLALSWVMYVCITNQSVIVDRILSFKFFIPLSRLTYSAYLIHPMIITGYYASMKRPLEFSHPTIVILYLGFMVVTYALAFPVSLILESPIVSLEKVIRNKFKKVQTT